MSRAFCTALLVCFGGRRPETLPKSGLVELGEAPEEPCHSRGGAIWEHATEEAGSLGFRVLRVRAYGSPKQQKTKTRFLQG